MIASLDCFAKVKRGVKEPSRYTISKYNSNITRSINAGIAFRERNNRFSGINGLSDFGSRDRIESVV